MANRSLEEILGLQSNILTEGPESLSDFLSKAKDTDTARLGTMAGTRALEGFLGTPGQLINLASDVANAADIGIDKLLGAVPGIGSSLQGLKRHLSDGETPGQVLGKTAVTPKGIREVATKPLLGEYVKPKDLTEKAIAEFAQDLGSFMATGTPAVKAAKIAATGGTAKVAGKMLGFKKPTQEAIKMGSMLLYGMKGGKEKVEKNVNNMYAALRSETPKPTIEVAPLEKTFEKVRPVLRGGFKDKPAARDFLRDIFREKDISMISRGKAKLTDLIRIDRKISKLKNDPDFKGIRSFAEEMHSDISRSLAKTGQTSLDPLEKAIEKAEPVLRGGFRKTKNVPVKNYLQKKLKDVKKMTRKNNEASLSDLFKLDRELSSFGSKAENASAKNFIKTLQSGIEESIEGYGRTSIKPMDKIIDSVDEIISTGLKDQTAAKRSLSKTLEGISKITKDGKVGIIDLVQMDRDLNAYLYNREFTGIKNSLKAIKSGIYKSIEEYGEKNPEWYKLKKSADTMFKAMKTRSFLHDRIINLKDARHFSIKNPLTWGLLGLYNPAVAKTGAGAYGFGFLEKGIKQVAKDPRIAKIYSKLIPGAIHQSLPAIANSIAKLDRAVSNVTKPFKTPKGMIKLESDSKLAKTPARKTASSKRKKFKTPKGMIKLD